MKRSRRKRKRKIAPFPKGGGFNLSKRQGPTLVTEDQVRQIRREYAQGMRGKTEAERYGIKPTTYNSIGARRSHRSVKDI